MTGLAWEDRWNKLSPDIEAEIETMVQEHENLRGKMETEQRENYKAALRFLVSKTLAYDASCPDT